MKKNYDYDKIEKRIKEGFEGVERDIRFRNIEEVSVKKEKEKRAPGPALQIIGTVLAAAIVGGGTFGALKYAEYRGSRIAPGSDPGIDSVYTEYGSVTSFYEDVQPDDTTLPSPDEPDKNVCFFKEVTVIDPAADGIVTDADLPPQLKGSAFAEIRNEHVSELGYGIYTDGESLIIVDKDGTGVKEFACGDGLFPLIIAETDHWQPDVVVTFGQLIVTEDKDTGKVTFIHTRFAGYSGLYGGTTLIEYFDTQTKETGVIRVYLPESAVEYVYSSGYLGTYELAKLSAEDTANGKTIGCTCTVVPIGRGNNETQEDFFVGYLRYDNGNYYFGEPYDIGDDGADTTGTGTDTTDTGTEFKGEYGLAIECDNGDAYHNGDAYPPVYASRVYNGGELISQKTDEAKVFICQISRDEGLNDLLPLHNNIRTPWAVISVEVGDKMFESVALAEEWIKDRIRVSSSTVNGFEITVTVTWDTVPGSDRLPADDRTEYSYRFTAEYRMLHDNVPADERVLIEYSDGKLRFIRIAAEPEFTVEKSGGMKASELDIHKLFAMLNGHDAMDDPWDLVPSVTLRMMLDGETIYAFEMSHDGAVNVMRYHGSDRGFVASMKLTADEIKTLSGESGHDATETTTPAPEETTERIPTVPVEHGIQIAELQSWLSRRMWNGMNEGELLDMATGEKDLKKAIFAMAYDQIDREDDGTFVRYKTGYCDFLYFAEKDTFRIREARMILRPGTNFSLPFGVTLDMSPEEALSAMGYTEEEIVSLNGNPVSAGDYNINYNGITLTVTYTYGNAAFGLELGGEAQAYLEIE